MDPYGKDTGVNEMHVDLVNESSYGSGNYGGGWMNHDEESKGSCLELQVHVYAWKNSTICWFWLKGYEMRHKVQFLGDVQRLRVPY